MQVSVLSAVISYCIGANMRSTNIWHRCNATTSPSREQFRRPDGTWVASRWRTIVRTLSDAWVVEQEAFQRAVQVAEEITDAGAWRGTEDRGERLPRFKDGTWGPR